MTSVYKRIQILLALALATASMVAMTIPAHAALPVAVGDDALPSLAPMVKQASPAVVNIAVRGTVEAQRNNPFMNDPFFRRFFDNPGQSRPRQTVSAGSGVIVDASNGYILTNHHVVENADSITVTLFDDRELDARVVGSDASADIAVLQVPTERLAQIPYANSDDIQVGDFVVAIGNPFGFSHTVTSGIISGLGRYGLSNNRGSYENFVQTDAAINPGNSGGALLNLRGELVGINTAIVSRSGGNVGIGFAIPINMARNIMDQLIDFGEVRRGLLGVRITNVDADVSEAMDLGVDYGALIDQVTPNSAAEKADLRIEDVIVAVDGDRVRNATELRNAIGLRREGKRVDIDYYRDGTKRTVSATLGSMVESLQQASNALHPGLEGATFAELPQKRVMRKQSGVLVESVEANTAAAGYDLRDGDIITRVNKKRINNLEEFSQAAGGQETLVLTILRGATLQLKRIG